MSLTQNKYYNILSLVHPSYGQDNVSIKLKLSYNQYLFHSPPYSAVIVGSSQIVYVKPQSHVKNTSTLFQAFPRSEWTAQKLSQNA